MNFPRSKFSPSYVPPTKDNQRQPRAESKQKGTLEEKIMHYFSKYYSNNIIRHYHGQLQWWLSERQIYLLANGLSRPQLPLSSFSVFFLFHFFAICSFLQSIKMSGTTIYLRSEYLGVIYIVCYVRISHPQVLNKLLVFVPSFNTCPSLKCLLQSTFWLIFLVLQIWPILVSVAFKLKPLCSLLHSFHPCSALLLLYLLPAVSTRHSLKNVLEDPIIDNKNSN